MYALLIKTILRRTFDPLADVLVAINCWLLPRGHEDSKQHEELIRLTINKSTYYPL